MRTMRHGGGPSLALAALAALAAVSACGTEMPRAASAPAAVAAATPSVPAPAAPAAAPDPVEPIEAVAGAWQWVPQAGSECGDGSATGFGIYPVAGATTLMIFLEGGGRCDSAATCGAKGATAVNLTGYGAAAFGRAAGGLSGGIFSRSDSANPLARASFVYVPYCTGDDHSGDNVAPYGTHHRGYANLGLMLPRLAAHFGGLTQVVLTGSSAGGSGAFWNFYRAQQIFGEVPVALVDDAGPFLGSPTVEIAPSSVSAWNLAKTVPAGCPQCLPGPAPAGLQNFYAFFAAALPGARGALVTSDEDAHVAGRDQLAGPQFAEALARLAQAVAPVNPNFKFFLVPSNRHTWLGGVNGSLQQVAAGGVSLDAFLQAQLSGSAAWRSVP